MSIIVVDIETFGNPPEPKDLILPTEADVKLGNIKDPQKRQDKIDEVLPGMIEDAIKNHDDEFDKEWRKNALNPLKSKIIACSFINEEAGIKECIVCDDESSLIGELNELVKKVDRANYATWMHYNGDSFDLKYLNLAARKYNATELIESLPKHTRDGRSLDIMKLFGFTDYKSMMKLNDLLFYYGLEGKEDGMSGDMVHDAWLNGEKEKIRKYCLGDSEKLLDLYKIYLHNSKLPF